MSYEIRLSKKADKFLTKLEKSSPHDFDKIDYFLKNTLVTTKNPCALPNSKHLKGFGNNLYRWRLGDYRIIGIVENDEFQIIEIVKITKRDEKTYKGL